MPTDDDDRRPARRPKNSLDDVDDDPLTYRSRRDDDGPRQRGGSRTPHNRTVVLVLGFVLGLGCAICGLLAYIIIASGHNWGK